MPRNRLNKKLIHAVEEANVNDVKELLQEGASIKYNNCLSLREAITQFLNHEDESKIAARREIIAKLVEQDKSGEVVDSVYFFFEEEKIPEACQILKEIEEEIFGEPARELADKLRHKKLIIAIKAQNSPA